MIRIEYIPFWYRYTLMWIINENTVDIKQIVHKTY